jgi:hypothetical protein
MSAALALTAGALVLKLLNPMFREPSLTFEPWEVPELAPAENYRLLLILPGLLCAAVSLLLHFKSHRPVAYLEMLSRPMRGSVLLALAVVFAGTFLALSTILVLRIAGKEWIPWKPGSLVIVWLMAAPASAVACRIAWRNLRSGEMGKQEESAALLALAALVCALACWAIAGIRPSCCWR